jgi:hypothetical protein
VLWFNVALNWFEPRLSEKRWNLLPSERFLKIEPKAPSSQQPKGSVGLWTWSTGSAVPSGYEAVRSEDCDRDLDLTTWLTRYRQEKLLIEVGEV